MATTAMISSYFSIQPSLPSPLCTPNRRHSPILYLPRRTTIAAPLLSSATSSPPPFLAPDDLAKLHLLQRFTYSSTLVDGGSLAVGLMGAGQIDPTVWLLADSFAESMLVPKRYVGFLAFLVRQYVLEKQALLPSAATLVGVYRGEGKEEEELAGTVEISFDGRGANASPPTPVPPPDSPYICNMAVKQELRRRGIGWHLLKASEELITQMSKSSVVYLHCRLIDAAPLQLYAKAGYSVVKTDTILTWLTLQRRKHLMCKRLPAFQELPWPSTTPVDHFVSQRTSWKTGVNLDL